ncbi:MAG: hypothetical protein KF860_03675 [Cyclobacteriaceae bacterium]|nr:hypothetical protein [Cyclobacteriaceae bacterium]
MPILTKITDLLYRKQKVVEVVIIFLFFSLVAFRFTTKTVELFWSNYPSVAIVAAITTALLAIIWIRIEKQKMELLIHGLQKKNAEKGCTIEGKLLELSSRQREVFDLIVSGKSNKEITAELHIELSTLKTHINQVYKILGIRNRKETRNFGNGIDSSQ